MINCDKCLKKYYCVLNSNITKKSCEMYEEQNADITIDKAIDITKKAANSTDDNADLVQLAKWLEELKEYRKLGTIEELKNIVKFYFKN